MNTIRSPRVKSVHYMIAGSLVALALAVTPLVADAADPAATPTVTVSYGDLNIDSPQGARVFYARLHAAATRVCGAADIRDLNAHSLFRKCFQHAMDSAVAQLNKPTVTALYAQTARRSSAD